MATCLAIALLVGAQDRSDDPVEALRGIPGRGLPADEAAGLARRTLLEGLDREIAAGMRALDENRPDQLEIHLVRAATLARPYDEDYARLLAGLILSARRQTRTEGAALVHGIAEDIRQGKSWADRLAAARKGASVRAYAGLLDALESAAKRWQANPPKPEAVEAEAAKWAAVRPAVAGVGCDVCGRSGEVPCGCKQGMTDGECRTCGGAGTVPCLLCEGKGTLEHHGFVGTMRFTLSKALSFRLALPDGRVVPAKLNPQVLTWRVEACNGRGHFKLKTESKLLEPGGKSVPAQELDQGCAGLWEQLSRFVFTGRAKIEVQVEGGRMQTMTRQTARRFLADYGKCRKGRIVCERCEGRLTDVCPSCKGRGSSPVPCERCGGAATVVCAACGFVGDTAWLAAEVPPARVAGLAAALDGHAEAVREWARRRARTAYRRETLEGRLKEARQGLDPAAVLTAGSVTVPCPTCKGKGESCEECWGTGKREYVEGTPQYERYAAVAQIERQIADAERDLRAPAPLPQVRFSELPPDRPAPPPPPERPPSPPAGMQDVPGLIAAADSASEEGIRHLEVAKTSGDDETWISESRRALEKLREAQAAYVKVQEACEAAGVGIPADLMAKIRRNLQALVIARKQAP